MVTLCMHVAIGMIRRKQNIPVANYIQKNVCSIISVNCLLDLTLLPYFENIFVCFCGLFGKKRTIIHPNVIDYHKCTFARKQLYKRYHKNTV